MFHLAKRRFRRAPFRLSKTISLPLLKGDGSKVVNKINKATNLSYDYIIVGGGSAGSIVASKLGQTLTNNTILLIENGPQVNDDCQTVWDPTQWTEVENIPQLEWEYKSVAQFQLNNRIIDQGRAKGLGGCALHNAMVYVRGGKLGFDRWESQFDCQGWNYDNIVTNFNNVESIVNVVKSETNEFIDSLITACNNVGIPYIDDYNTNGGDQICVSPFQFTQTVNDSNASSTNTFRRVTSASAYIGTSPQNLVNLDIATNLFVNKVNVNTNAPNTVSGVNVSYGGESFDIDCNKEVILSGGSINTPQLLMVSGIGPSSMLSQFGIKVLNELNGVGTNYQDDLYVPVGYSVNSDKIDSIPDQLHGLLGSVIFDRLNMAENDLRTNIEASMSFVTMPDTQQSLFFFYPNMQLLQSRGTLSLLSNSPSIPIQIDPNYLSNSNDMNNCIDAIRLFRTIGENSGLSQWLGEEVFPGSEFTSDQQLEAFVREYGDTCYHCCGTCQMGNATTNSNVVCNASDLKVVNMDNLRVIDASIIPETVSGNTAAATMMIADKGTQFVIDDATK